MYDNVENILKRLGVPLFFQEVDREEDIYIIWDIYTKDREEFADDRQTNRHWITLIVCHRKIRPGLILYKSIEDLELETDLILKSEISLPKSNEYYRKNFKFIIEEVK